MREEEAGEGREREKERTSSMYALTYFSSGGARDCIG
jgi:hypothetical protein